MKLIRDFGVRALLATLSTMGMLAIVLYALVVGKTGNEDLVVMQLVSTGWILSMTFYFTKNQ